MRNTRKFEIQIPSGQTVFYPGQVIQGQVCVEITENMLLRSFTISCICSSEVQWENGKTTEFNRERYLSVQLTLYGNPPPDGGNVILEAGNHVFPFQFVLPVKLPGSYEGEHGCYVRHCMIAVMDRPSKRNKNFKMLFTVASILDLNTIRDAAIPIQGQYSESICCCYRWWGNDGEVTANFRLEKQGFVPGESVAIYGEVKDGAHAGINGVDAFLMSRTFYKSASGDVKKKTVQIGKLHHNQVSPGGSDVWNGEEKIRIPPIPPSYLVHCGIIDIRYFIQIRVNLPCYFRDLRLALSIIIGTVPLHATVQQHAGHRQYRRNYQNASNDTHDNGNRAVTQQPQAASASAPPLPASVGDLDLPPTFYQDCYFCEVDTNRPEEKYTKFVPSSTNNKNFV